MADKIRVGIVGATVTQGGSGWGEHAHVPALKALRDYEVKAVCTAHEDTAKALAAAEEMAALARQRSLPTIVGLQGRSDPTLLYAHDLIKDGYIGEVLTASLTTVAPAVHQRGPGRIWQGVRANGANVLTITGGHAIDSMCAVLGEFAEVSARVTTRIPEWRTLEGTPVPVDSPDSITVIGRT